MDARRTALDTVGAWRGEIERAVAAGSSSPLAVVLARSDTGHAYLVKVLDVHPCLGKVAGRRLMAGLGLAPRVRIGEMTAGEVRSVVSACRCSSG
ncbi:MAG: hypothetical protein ACKOFT_06500 [Actinomycetota bacterium]